MRKRRILLGTFLAIMSLSLSACDFLPENIGNVFKHSSSEQSSSRRIRPSGSDSPSEHVHKFSETWEHNNVKHWRKAICGHDLITDEGEHDFYSAVVKQPTCDSLGEKVDICKVCDFRRTEYLPKIDHDWVQYDGVEPTCTTSGYSKVYCRNCGDFDEIYLPPLGHEYETVTYINPTCSTVGHWKKRCINCGEIFEEEVPTVPHQWSGTETLYDLGYPNVPYTVDHCMVCGATQIKIRAREGSPANTEYKQNDALNYDYIKLATNGGYITYNFEYSNFAVGTLYQHAIFDQNYNGLDYYNYRSGNSGGYNFQMTVNDQIVDLSRASTYSYADFFNDGEYIDGLTNVGYSNAGTCLIGDISLNQGTNTMVYTRNSAYTLCIDYFILVVQNIEHTHVVSDSWRYDDDYHWLGCDDPNCPTPNVRIDSAPHTFGESTVVSESTCCSEGIAVETCSVCGYRHYYSLPITEHNWDEGSVYSDIYCYSSTYYMHTCRDCGYQMMTSVYNDHAFNETGATYGVNSQGFQYSLNTCQRCNRTVMSLPFGSGEIVGSYSSGKLKVGSTITWRMPVFDTGYIALYLPCRMSAENPEQIFDPSLYQVSISGSGRDILLPYATYGDMELNTYENRYYQFAEYYVNNDDLNNGEIEISFTSNVSQYRLIFDGEMRIEY